MATYAEAIATYVAAQTALDDQIDAAVTNIQGDVKFLNDTIAALQNSPGTITPGDQKLLDDLQARAQALAAKTQALADLTPDVPAPPAPEA